jgi:hypothetical protein
MTNSCRLCSMSSQRYQTDPSRPHGLLTCQQFILKHRVSGPLRIPVSTALFRWPLPRWTHPHQTRVSTYVKYWNKWPTMTNATRNSYNCSRLTWPNVKLTWVHLSLRLNQSQNMVLWAHHRVEVRLHYLVEYQEQGHHHQDRLQQARIPVSVVVHLLHSLSRSLTLSLHRLVRIPDSRHLFPCLLRPILLAPAHICSICPICLRVGPLGTFPISPLSCAMPMRNPQGRKGSVFLRSLLDRLLSKKLPLQKVTALQHPRGPLTGTVLEVEVHAE